MAAKSGGGTGARRSANDQARAAYMKAHKIERKTCLCPMCHKPTTVGNVGFHIRGCKGR